MLVLLITILFQKKITRVFVLPANHWQRYDLFLTNANKRGTILLLGTVLYSTYTFCYYEFPIPHLALRNDKWTNVFTFHMYDIHLSRHIRGTTSFSWSLSSMTSKSFISCPSMTNLTSVRTSWKPALPAAPGLMCKRSSIGSYITLRRCE